MNSFLGMVQFDKRPPDETSLRSAARFLTGPNLGMASRGTESAALLQVRWGNAIEQQVEPLVSDDQRLAMVWDGRLDNRDELCSTLRAYPSETANWSDAKFALKAYQRWGEVCAKYLVGDFAFAVWHEHERRLFCARDPMGIRPFYYREEPGRILFGSDIQPIRWLADSRLGFNKGLLALFLRGMFGSPHETFISGVSQLPAGHSMTVTRGAINFTRHWEPNPFEPITHKTLDEYVDHFLDVFDTAIRARLRGTQPVGISLSGGLDSTSIACSVSELERRTPNHPWRLIGLSSVFDEIKSADESEFIRAVESQTGIDTHFMTADELWGWKPVGGSDHWWSQPYPIPFMARHDALLSAARGHGCTAMLTGEGGDELFYQGFSHMVDLLRNRRFREFRHEYNHLYPASRREVFKATAHWVAPTVILKGYDWMKPRKARAPWLNESRIRRDQGAAHSVRSRDRKNASLYADSEYVGIVNIARAPFLPYLTEAYRRHGIEARHPFYDRRVVEFLSRIPPELKFQHGRTKYLLRYAMRQRVPESILLRQQKTHFSDSSLVGLRRETPRFLRLVEKGYAHRQGWVDFAEFERCLALAQEGHLPFASRLATVIAMEVWAQQHQTTNFVRNNEPGAVLDTTE